MSGCDELVSICDMCGSEMEDDAYGYEVPLCSDGCVIRFHDERMDDDDSGAPDDEDYVARPALGRPHPYGGRSV